MRSMRWGLLAISSVAAMAAWTFAAQAADQPVETARDVRMQTRTRWDYQPGQGPRRAVRDEDYFRPASPRAGQPATPPPALKPGDWRDPPPPTPSAQIPDLTPSPKPATETAVAAGFQVSSYDYRESSLDVKIKGEQFSGTLLGTAALGGQWFLRGDARFSGGAPDYSGSGHLDGTPNYIGEVRAAIGRDLLRSHFGLSPYVGLGYRYLLHDLRGTTSTGAKGYRRESQYLFVPIGLEPRMTLANGARLSLTAEFDPILRGWQESKLSDGIAAYPDIANRQKGGYGLRGEFNYQQARWSVGPFVNYWNVNQSSTDCETGPTGLFVCGTEPHNHTLEYGLQLRYRFY